MALEEIKTDALGKRFLRSLLHEKNQEVCLLNGITRDSFFGDAKRCWDYLYKHLETYSVWPTPNQIEENVGCSLPEDAEDLVYIVDLLRKRTLGILLDKDIRAAIDQIENRDPDKALEVISNIVATHYTSAKKSKIVSFRKSGTERILDYKKTKEEGGFNGIPTYWPKLNKRIQGWGNGTFNVIAGRSNQGKAFRNDMPVITPMGEKPIGDLLVGDLVYSVDGTPTKVTGVFPQGIKKLYEITFADNASVICSGDHLWEVSLLNKQSTVITTRDLLNSHKQNQYKIPITKPVQFAERNFYIHPYLLGLLIGDGCFINDIVFSTLDPEMLNLLEEHLPVEIKINKAGKDYRLVARYGSSNLLRRELQYYKLSPQCRAADKFIPYDYLYCSIDQRKELLKGLLDTDSYVCPKTGIIEYCSMSKQLALDVKWTVQSLGGRATIGYKPKVNAWRVFIKINDFLPYKLTRKANAWKKSFDGVNKKPVSRYIRSIKEVASNECTCITVEHPRKLFLTKDFIVTHNSWHICLNAEYAERHTTKIAQEKDEKPKPILLVTLEMSANKIQRRLDAIRYKIPFSKLRDAELSEDALKEWEEGILKAQADENVCTDCSGLGILADLDHTTESCKKCAGTGKIKAVKSDIIIADKNLVTRVADVVGLVRQYNPIAVFIDGGYRFEGRLREGRGGSSQDWSKTVEVTNDLQIFAEKTDIPWIVTTQFGDSNETGKEYKKGKGKEKPVRAWNVRYGKEWFINPDILIGIHAGEQEFLIKQQEIHVLKFRDNDKSIDPFSINWDLDKMLFDAVTPDEKSDPFDAFGKSEEKGSEESHKIEF